MPDLDEFADISLKNLKKQGRLRSLKDVERSEGVYLIKNGKRLISFSCNDYLGLSGHPKVKQAAIDAIEKYGAGSGASRLITGSHPLYKKLEDKLAKLKGTQSALVFGSGYLANVGIIPALCKKGDLIIADKLVHACLIDGAKLSGATLKRFKHNDVNSCEKILKENRSGYNNCLIITDGVFSMDGDVAPVDNLCELAEKYDAWLMTDDAHGLGILNGGTGSALNKKPHIQMGTLSKAAGVYGGYVCASQKVIDYLVNHARSFIYSTGLPPSVIASAIASLEIIGDDKDLIKKPLENARYFTSLLGMDEAQSSIVPLIIGDEDKALAASEFLEDNGFLVSAIRPPTVPKGTARLRFTFSALHSRSDIEKLARLVRKNVILSLV